MRSQINQLMKEIHPDYYVTEDGNIYSDKTKRMVAQRMNPRGYCVVNLSINGKCKTFEVHRLVALAYIPNSNNLPVINHKNGIKTDNRVENLEWVTCKGNLMHAIKNGLWKPAKGKDTCHGRFEVSDVLRIRELKEQGIPTRKIAKMFNVSQGAIVQITLRHTYAWVQ